MSPDELADEPYAGLIEDAENHRDGETADALRRLGALERVLGALAVDGAAGDLKLMVLPKTSPTGERMWFAGRWPFGSDYALEGGTWRSDPLAALLALAEALEAGE